MDENNKYKRNRRHKSYNTGNQQIAQRTIIQPKEEVNNKQLKKRYGSILREYYDHYARKRVVSEKIYTPDEIKKWEEEHGEQ